MPETLGPSPEEMGIQPEQPSTAKIVDVLSKKVDQLYADSNSSWDEQVKTMGKLAVAKERLFNEVFQINQRQTPEEQRLAKDVLGMDMKEAREKIPAEIGKRFDAHGIAKTDQLKNLLSILTNGIDKNRPLHTLQLRRSAEDENAAGNMGAVGPYDTGGFILVSHPDKSLTEGIALVMVNYQYRESAKLLAKKFPNVLFATPEGTQKALAHLLRQKA